MSYLSGELDVLIWNVFTLNSAFLVFLFLCVELTFFIAPRLPKLPSQCYSNEPGNLGILGGSIIIQHMFAIGEPGTISSLVEELKPRLEQVSVLYRLYRSGVAMYRDQGGDAVPSAQQAAGLLADMYEKLLECDVIGEEQSSMVS